MPSEDSLAVHVITNGPFMENCYILVDVETNEAFVVDPGDEAEKIVKTVADLGVSVTAVIATHGHIDHIGAVAPVARELDVPFYMHADDKPWAERINESASRFGLAPKEIPTVTDHLVDGQVIALGASQMKVLHTPGHTAGGCCLLFEDQKVVVVGDTLFSRSIGRTDLPGGSYETLIESIREKLLTLSDDVCVYCGHGPETTIGDERTHNPFVGKRGM